MTPEQQRTLRVARDTLLEMKRGPSLLLERNLRDLMSVIELMSHWAAELSLGLEMDFPDLFPKGKDHPILMTAVERIDAGQVVVIDPATSRVWPAR